MFESVCDVRVESGVEEEGKSSLSLPGGLCDYEEREGGGNEKSLDLP